MTIVKFSNKAMLFVITSLTFFVAYNARAEEAGSSSAAEMARKLQDPLANISAIMTDNDILFKSGDNETSYSFQVQPVQAWSFDDLGFNFVARGVIPILGLAAESQIPAIGDPTPAGNGMTWGLGDILTQFYFSPKTDSAWKWGLGPVVSWQTRTSSKLSGAGWGVGPSAVVVGNLSENVSSAFILNHLWSTGGDFSTTSIQPMIFYNIPSLPGMSLAYNSTISYDWQASSGNHWTVPLGAGVTKMFDLGEGYGIDTSIGAYWNVVRPDGAAAWKLNWQVSFLLP